MVDFQNTKVLEEVFTLENIFVLQALSIQLFDIMFALSVEFPSSDEIQSFVSTNKKRCLACSTL